MKKNRLKLIIGAVIISFFVLMPLTPADVTAEKKSETFKISHTIIFNEEDFIFESIDEYDLISFEEGYYLSEIGKPMLPTKNIRLALPSGMIAENIQVTVFESHSLDGQFNIFPAQAPMKISEKNQKIISLQKDKTIYHSSEKYPNTIVKICRQSDLAGQSFAEIQINPIQYIPSEKKIELYYSITFSVEGSNGYVCGDYLPQSISDKSKESYQKMIQNMVVNPSEIELQIQDLPQPSGVEPGEYDYVIITTTGWVDDFQPLADWKIRKGIPTKIVSKDWIYNEGGYSGSDTEKIRAFVNDAHSNWGTTYFLLGGDTGYIPHVEKHYSLLFGSGVEQIYAPADTYYADYDGDFTCEVFVGRASVTSDSRINTFINKIFTYEQNAPVTNYAQEIGLFGFDLDSSTHGESCKNYIDTNYIPSSWNVNAVYDSHSGDHETNVKSIINEGQNLINHIDHCYTYVMGVGDYNHNKKLYTNEVDNFDNGDKQSIFYSIGCYASAFDAGSCISEHFVRDSNGGCIAFIGNSRYGIYSRGNTNTLSLKFDRYFFRSLFSEGLYHLGEAFTDHKNDVSLPDDYYKCIFDELNLLGDPELPILTEDPISFDVSHQTQVTADSQMFLVHVSENGGGNVEQALVCVWKKDDQGNTEVYERAYTDSSGNAELFITPVTTGILFVTVTKHNYNAYLDDIVVNLPDGSPYLPTDPLPENEAGPVFLNTDLRWSGGDPEEDPVTYDVYFGTTSPPSLVETLLSDEFFNPGPLDYAHVYYWRIVTHDDNGHSTIGPIWSFTTLTADHMYIESTSGNMGQTGKLVNVCGKWTQTIGAYQIHISYDTSKLDFWKFDFTDTIGETADMFQGGSDYDGLLVFGAVWYNNPLPQPGEDILAKLVFNFTESAANGNEINLDFDLYGEPLDPSFYTNDQGYNFIPDAIDGVLSVQGRLCGDANDDGLINVGDAVYIINYIFKGGSAPSPLCYGDTNGDDGVDVGDAVYLINYIFKGGPAPIYGCCD